MAIGGSRLGFGAQACWATTNPARGSWAKTTFWPCRRGAASSPRIPIMNWRLSKFGQAYEADRNQSAVGRRHYLHSVEDGVCLLGGDSRYVFTQSRGMGVRPNTGGQVAD